MPSRTPALRRVSLLALALAGCHACREDHPYVPYSIESSPPTPADPEGGAAASSTPHVFADGGSPRFTPEPAAVAPPETARWAVGGMVLQAPDGHVFASAAVRDFDGDGIADAFAVVRSSEPGDPGELAYYRGVPSSSGAAPPPSAPTLFPPPPELLRDPSCSPRERLVAVGDSTVLVELGGGCAPRASTAPARWFAVVSGSSVRVRLAAAILDPPGAAALSVDADATDRDGDGLPDLSLTLALEGGDAPMEPGPRVAATFAWLDRPAGLSRDMGATESGFASLAATAAARATRSREAPSVPALVEQARALWRAACADGGSPRLVGLLGTGSITCGAAHPLESAGLAEVRAYVTLGDPLRAHLALERAERPPAAHTAARQLEALGWIAPIAPVVVASARLRAVAAVPLAGRGHEPAWGPLAFESSGKLLVRTAAGVVRVDPDAGDEASADSPANWRSAIASTDGATRWIETYDPCDGLPLHATFTTGGGEDLRDVPLPVAPPLGERCVGSHGALARALPIAWGPSGLEAIVEGEPVLISADLARASPLASLLDQPPALGGPRSPDGGSLVVPVGTGLLVQHRGRSRLLRAGPLEGNYAEQRDCTVSNDASHVACMHAGKAWVGAWPAPGEP